MEDSSSIIGDLHGSSNRTVVCAQILTEILHGDSTVLVYNYLLVLLVIGLPFKREVKLAFVQSMGNSFVDRLRLKLWHNVDEF